MAFEPGKITRKHILEAVKHIESDGIELIPSTKFNVVIDGKYYPPKEIMRFAHEKFNGERLWLIKGGETTNSYLKKLGFEVRQKPFDNDPVQELILKYKEIIREKGLKDEIYKWELISENKGKPDINAKDFALEIKSMSLGNLVYQLFPSSAKRIVEFNPEKYRNILSVLFDESKPLIDRYSHFKEQADNLDLDVGGIQTHFHDERTAATLLTFHDPEKYTFYKDSFYQKYCQLVKIKPRKPGKKLCHYYEILESFIADYIDMDEELVNLVLSFVPQNLHHVNSNMLIAQDILYQALDNTANQKRRYWRIGTTNDSVSYWEEMKSNSIAAIGWSDLGDLNLTNIQSKNDVANLFNEKNYPEYKKNMRTKKAGEIFNFFSVAIEGDIAVAQDGHRIKGIGIIKDGYRYDNNFHFSHVRPVDWIIFNPDFDNPTVPLTTFAQIVDAEIINQIDKLLNNYKEIMDVHPLNQILFGPPGTGKTYTTIDKALEIIDNKFYKENKENRAVLKEQFDNYVKSGQIVFTTFHQSMCYEDFVEGIKPVIAVNSPSLNYTIEQGIFKSICLSASQQTGIKNFDEIYEQFINDHLQEEPLKLKTPVLKRQFVVELNTNKNCVAIPNNGAGVRMVVTKEMIYNYLKDGKIKDWKPYTVGICDFISSTYDLKLEHFSNEIKNYVLIIDEINRGNVSQIFGELITLIEKDKRLGNDEALEITLTYSKEKFGVPANLFIIGTMNTADRSVEALDTALRRRFSFVEMPPEYGLDGLKYNVSDIYIPDLLKTINDRIELLLDKDHAVGHSYFLKPDYRNCDQDTLIEHVRQAFTRNIIPLLQEYFYGDYGKIGLVLGDGFVSKKDSVKFASFNYAADYDFSDKDVFKIENAWKKKVGSVDGQESSASFIQALRTLMNKKNE